MAGIRRSYTLWSTGSDAEILGEELTLAAAESHAKELASSQPHGLVMIVSSETGRSWDISA